MRRTWLCLVLACALGPAARAQEANEEAPAAAAKEPPPVPLVVLEDQFGRPHFLAAERGDVVVLIYGDRHSVTANQQLGAALHIHFHPQAQGKPAAEAMQAPVRPVAHWPEELPLPDVHVTPIVCVGNLPGFAAAMVRAYVRTQVSDVVVCLDFEDKMQQYFGLAGGVTNVAVVDTRGRVRYRAHGSVGVEQFKQLAEFIEQLRLEAQPGPAPEVPAPR